MKKALLAFAIALPVITMSQCYPDRHNTSWNEAWISCEERDNPNPERARGHWILYDFGHMYRLGNTKIWNINSPDFLESGIKDFYIDFSPDGLNWENLGQFTLSQAPGESRYEGEDITSFGGDTARFVLLTAIDTHGGACAGISEVKIDVVEVVSRLQIYQKEECFEVSVYPNPHISEFNLSINTFCEGRLDYSLYDHTGKLIHKETISSDKAIKLRQIATGDLPAGLYHLVVTQKKAIARYPVMKIR
jgi:hypothetical protein